MRLRTVVVAAVLLVTSCASSDDPIVQSPASTTAPTTSTTAPATSTTTTTVVPPVAAMAATATCPAVPARRAPDPNRPRYRLQVDVRLSDNVVDGRLSVDFTPDAPTDRLVFRLWPNGPRLQAAGARLDVGPVSLDGAPPRHGDVPDLTTLVVRLDRTLLPGRTVTASLPWRLTLPGPASDRIARIGDTVRLASFFPILAWEPGTGWGVQPPTSNFAEASVSPTADFDVQVSTPPGLQVLATGVPRDGGRWEARAVRDFGLSVGRFRLAEGQSGGVKVTVGVEAGLADDPTGYLRTVVRALDDFSGRFGPYPWSTFTLAITPRLSGGIEYPTHVLQGPGTQGRTTPHEVGHQWFYALVGNDQGRDPWLDEGLATWAEARFLGNLAEFRSRPMPADAAGRSGAPMTYWNGRSSYYRGVYVQGAQALAALGDAALVDCALRHYVARHAFRVAQTKDLVTSLEVVFPDARATLARFGAVPR